jgi:lipoyl(octanoyl) transferase
MRMHATPPLPLPDRWAVRRDPPGDGVANMAADATLAAWARAHACGVVRVYGWARPTVSFGRHEAVAGRFTAASLAAAGVDAVRRPTGGRALLHHREVTYAVALPLPAGTGWRTAYAAVNARLVAALRALGIPAQLAPEPQGSEGAAALCFDAPAAGEVVVHGRKLVGSAVWRDGDGYLQHGSLLWEDDQARLVRAAAVPVPPPPPAATLAALAPQLTPAAVETALVEALTAPAAGHPAGERVAYGASPADLEAEAQARARLADPAWLWRR